eukprot:m.1016591 g.1016591  ORF g.1016591 m.1016591 type:complete len:895 (-) comp24080_c0_seq4:1045-3729(-)
MTGDCSFATMCSASVRGWMLFVSVTMNCQIAYGQNSTVPTFTYSALNLSASARLTWLTNSSAILIDPATETQLGACFYTSNAGSTFSPLSSILIHNVTDIFLAPLSSRASMQNDSSSSAAVLDAVIVTNAHIIFTVVASALPTIVPVNVDNIGTSVSVDPENSSNLLLYDSATHILSLSTDMGDQWNTIMTGVYTGNTQQFTAFSWGFPGVDPRHKIYAVNQSAIISRTEAIQNQFLSSTDFGSTWTAEVDIRVNVRQVTINAQYIAVSTGGGMSVSSITTDSNDCPSGMSMCRGFYETVVTPLNTSGGGDNPEWTVIDASEGALVAAYGYTLLNGTSNTSFRGESTVYVSGSGGTVFSASLPDVLFTTLGDNTVVADVVPLPFVRGVYFATQQAANTSKSTLNATFGGVQYSMVTFDFGTSWQRIPVPLNTSSTCAGDMCSLHLHLNTIPLASSVGAMAFIPGIVGSSAAPGIAVATGNVGTQQHLDPTVLNVYYTDDAGATWTQINSGPAYYALANGGSLLVLADPRHPDTLQWSTDGGAVFHEASVPGYASGEVSFGLLSSASPYDIVVLHATSTGVRAVDFRTAIPNNCTAADFLPWSPPATHAAAACIMGSINHYNRLSNKSACVDVNGLALPAVVDTPCACTAFDYECEYAYTRNATTGQCTTTEDLTTDDDIGSGGDSPQAPVRPWNCIAGGVFNYTPGYRKTPFNKCVGCAFTQCIPQPCTPTSTVMQSTSTVQAVVVSSTASTTSATPANGTCLAFAECHGVIVCSTLFVDGHAVPGIPCGTTQASTTTVGPQQRNNTLRTTPVLTSPMFSTTTAPVLHSTSGGSSSHRLIMYIAVPVGFLVVVAAVAVLSFKWGAHRADRKYMHTELQNQVYEDDVDDREVFLE